MHFVAFDNLLYLDLDMERFVLIVPKVLDVHETPHIHKDVDVQKVHVVVDLREHVVKSNCTK